MNPLNMLMDLGIITREERGYLQLGLRVMICDVNKLLRSFSYMYLMRLPNCPLALLQAFWYCLSKP